MDSKGYKIPGGTPSQSGGWRRMLSVAPAVLRSKRLRVLFRPRRKILCAAP